MATRCLRQMLSTAVSRATTDDRYAAAVGLALPAPSRHEDPPLHAVVRAATRATEHVYGLLARRSSAWPISEFAATATVARSAGRGQHRKAEVAFVPGAARAAGGEIVGSPLVASEGGGGASVEDDGTARARLRGAVGAFGGLPVDWATTLPSFGLPNRANPGVAANEEADAVLRAAALPAVPPKLAEAFGPDVLAGRGGGRPLGAQEAWRRVEELEVYLGKGLISEDLRYRLAEALAGGGVMRGSPPPWRTLVRDAIARRVVLAGGGDRRQPLVVHFIAAFGQDRLEGGGGDLAAPGLLEAENFRAVRALILRNSGRKHDDPLRRGRYIILHPKPSQLHVPLCRPCVTITLFSHITACTHTDCIIKSNKFGRHIPTSNPIWQEESSPPTQAWP